MKHDLRQPLHKLALLIPCPSSYAKTDRAVIDSYQSCGGGGELFIDTLTQVKSLTAKTVLYLP